MADAKLFGKYNDVVIMLLGFLLTGVVGTYIAQVYTNKNAELSTANKIFADHTKLIGDRYAAMSQVMIVLAQNQKTPGRWKVSQVESRWDLYRTELQKWNSTRIYNRELIRLYFGAEIWNEERDIHYIFRAWGESLEHEQRRTGSVDFDCLSRTVDDLLVRTHRFSFNLAKAIQKGRIGASRPNTSVPENPRPEAPCLTARSQPTDEPREK